jgi:hypothetical protein
MDDLDRILAADDPLVPSAGFANRVMTAVRTAAAEEPPLPFPWGRFALGVAACVAAAASGAWFLGSVDAGAVGEELARVPGAREALFVAAVSVSVAEAFRLRARADF